MIFSLSFHSIFELCCSSFSQYRFLERFLRCDVTDAKGRHFGCFVLRLCSSLRRIWPLSWSSSSFEFLHWYGLSCGGGAGDCDGVCVPSRLPHSSSTAVSSSCHRCGSSRWPYLSELSEWYWCTNKNRPVVPVLLE